MNDSPQPVIRRRFLKALLLATILVAVAVSAFMFWFSPDSRVNRLFGGSVLVGPSGVDVVRKPIHVEAYRLGPVPEDKDGQILKLSEYPDISSGVPVMPDAAKRLADILLDPASYSWQRRKACIPRYGVRLHFQLEKESVDVLLCFECNLLAVYYRGVVSGADFDPARPALVREIRQLFPDDPAIKGLLDSN
ncbi:MAG TPA: hypothetical protein VHU84_14560 [Lacipirellulaceae bacterium]|jgi:hypothetical protein|nr:hypothetical protein [Lacipirellulaceae bacterium]